jgi:ribosome-binding protein aMBF1 (putative translation factor)
MRKNTKSGELHPKSKLTEDYVTMIRHLYELFQWGYKRLSKQFKVSVRTIRDVVHYKTWCN